MANRPFVKLNITLTSDPPDPTLKKTVYIKSEGTSGTVSFDTSQPEITEGIPKTIKVFGATASDSKDATKIVIRLAAAGQPIKELPITVWRVIAYNGEYPITENDYVYITSEPIMPELRTRIYPYGLTGNANWSLLMEYLRPKRKDSSTLTKVVDAGLIWNIDFSSNFSGGRFTAKVTYKNSESKPFVLYVRGTNPSELAAADYIGNEPFYAKAIAKQESGVQAQRTYLQFNAIGTLGPSWNDYKFCPNRSPDETGWGMFQLDNPPATITQLWNWKRNVDSARERMAQHRLEAANWIARQEQQQMQDAPEKPLVNYQFTWSGVTFKKGTAKTPVDACAIQRYNGVTPGWVIWWDRADKTWKQRPSTYLDQVCQKL